MALTDMQDVETPHQNQSLSASKIVNNNPDAPQFIKDALAEQHTTQMDMSVDYSTNNPYQVTLPGGFYSSSSLEGIQDEPSFIDTAKAQLYRMNATLQGVNALDSMSERDDPLFYDKPDGWTAKTNIDKFVNVRDEYMGSLLDAKSPKHQDQILQKIYTEQKRDDDIANGSWLGWLVGGGLGIVTDPMSYIPVAGWVKYGKVSSSFLKSAARSIPGGASYGLLSSAAEQADKLNGNLHDFVVDSFVKTAFSTVLFGALGAGGSFLEKMELWNLRNMAKAGIDGVDFKFATDEAGKITGFKTIHPGEGLSAQKVSFYDDMAKSAFNKSGAFKIPYVGTGIIKLAGMPVLGSPLINLINSKSQVVRAFVDRIADHNFVTKGVAEGEVAPRKFASLMNQEYANLRGLSVQYDALFFERNGIEIKNRLAANTAETALYLKNKGMEALGQQMDKDTYISREIFNDEVQQVIHSGNPSIHNSVNEAAAMSRKQMDTTYKAYRQAYNLPDDWMPPKTAEAFLTRVYDTAFMNTHQKEWVDIVSGWLRDADNTITQRMRPIRDLEKSIKDFEEKHHEAIYNLGAEDFIEAEEAYTTDLVPFITEVGPGIRYKSMPIVNRPETLLLEGMTTPGKAVPEMQLSAMRARLRAMKNELQNELRTNPDIQLHVQDWNALSSDEGKELHSLLKPLNDIRIEIKEQKKLITDLEKKASKELSAAKKTGTKEKAKPKAQEYVETDVHLQNERDKLRELEDKHFIELDSLTMRAHAGEINQRYWKKIEGSQQVQFKNPNYRLRFRKEYEAHFERETHAKSYYDTIMNQTPEDTINQVMGRFTGNRMENPLKSRTLLLPDQVLYNGKFMTNDLMAKISNYTSYLARRTHLKNVFNDVSIDGGIEPILTELTLEHNTLHTDLTNKKAQLQNKLEVEGLSEKEKKALEKDIRKVEKEMVSSRKELDKNRQVMNHIYEKMMGIQKLSRRAQQIKSAIMSITAWANLPFVPLTQINDLSAIGLQHGMWAFIRDGMYPLVQSFGGILKTKDSEALRKAAPSVNLALQDVHMGYADRNWGMHNNPYINLGRTVNTLEKIAHLSSNFTGTNYIDNMLQRITGSVVQSELMRIIFSSKAGKLSKRDGNYIRKYGIDPDKWNERMIAAFEKNGGGKSALGGYQSHFWQWEDMEAANMFSDAVFRSIKDTQISAGIIDAPLFTDDNGPIGMMGSMIRGFNGWAFASVNRYVIPSLQQADAEKLIGVMGMLATGYWVDPFRRIARGEEMFPDSLSDKEIFWSTVNNSGYFSYFANVMANANLISGGNLLGNLRSDKYKNRTRAGLLGPAWGTVNRMADVISALSSGEMNEADAKKMARMIPFANASWTALMSNHLVESLNLPKTRSQAHALKELG